MEIEQRGHNKGKTMIHRKRGRLAAAWSVSVVQGGETEGVRERKVEEVRWREREGMWLEHISRLVPQLEECLVVECEAVRMTQDNEKKERGARGEKKN
jgi:hypothetical protein